MTTVSTMKHALRSAGKSTNEQLENAAAAAAAEAALVREEEKIMAEDDEEVTSVESNEGRGHDEETAVERTMLTVALVNSVVVGQKNEGDAAAAAAASSSSPLKQRLRKRPRQSGQDLERLEKLQSSNEGGLATAAAMMTTTTAANTASKKAGSSRGWAAVKTEEGAIGSQNATVPNPLSMSAQPDGTRGRSLSSTPGHVPCPLPSNNVLLEPDGVDPAASDSRRKVNFTTETSSPTPATSRSRGFSIDLDLPLEFPDDTGSSDTPAGGRNRAFSFECFAFGINADEPLPPLDQSASSASLKPSSVGRPRGDSIIFDPVSFQDGGIHEQTGLERALTAVKPSSCAPVPASVPSSHVTSLKPAARSAPKRRTTPSSTAAAVATPTDATTTTCAPGGHDIGSSASVGNGSTTISEELLNKDGRIGIYLPEARRARIARFHAKRSKRIWRKRIKYDCRKKLADSRPRIKGRFVKRMETDE